MFTRKGYATSVSGKTANGCPVRSAEPPDNMDFHFISPCGAKLYEVLQQAGDRHDLCRSFSAFRGKENGVFLLETFTQSAFYTII